MTSLTHWEPFRDIDRFFDLDDDIALFPFARHRAPAIDVYEEGDTVVVEMPLPGFDPEKVNIAVEGDALTISGTLDKKRETEDRNYLHREVRRGSFKRSIRLPADVEGSKASATQENGVLTVRLPKSEKAKPKNIAIKAS